MAGDLLERLAALSVETAYADLPAPAVRATQTFLLDTLAVGVAGCTGPWRDETLRSALSWGAGGACRILGDGIAAPPATAAFVNAYQMHCLEFDCVHEGAVAHVMTAVAAAAMAESERALGERGSNQRGPVDGRRLLLALALGVEVAAALGIAATSPLRFFRPATVGVFGAAVAVGVLRSFGSAAIRRCFGHALGQVAGTMQAHEEGKPALPLQLGAAARAGIVAADLAGAGVPAPDHALEGRHGYFALFETLSDTGGIARKVGGAWRVTELSHKPYPSGRATHGAIDGVLNLRSRGVRPDNLVAMTLAAPPLIHQLVIRPARTDMDANYARLCFAYTGAAALECGRVGIEHFTEAELRRPGRLALAGRFAAKVNDTSGPAAFVPQTLTARLRDGTGRSVRIDALRGSPDRPLSREELEAKVRSCLSQVYGDDDRTRRLIDTVQALPELPDARALLDPITDTARARP
ncbi:MAG: MmgE/PrpD family protein [Gammaproteobacteria bacterium]|nr:MmgE/PrpD family protein [Gammaproteobacteria bacterium]